MDPNTMRKINKTAAIIALACVVAQKSLFAFFLWLSAFDFTTRRPALGLVAGVTIATGMLVFGCVFGAVSHILATEVAKKERSRNPQDCT